MAEELVAAHAHPELRGLTLERCGDRPVFLSRRLFEVVESSANDPAVALGWEGVWGRVLDGWETARMPVYRLWVFDVVIPGGKGTALHPVWVKEEEEGLLFQFANDF